ncbi:AimR family lysis-lysogeny pheromone receptor [Halobacillus sp. BBL2006]|uniref:AimR family lysis-lysogeny pheromone receptor n=1 Tax=Halobacillus sp. BBL2006 TaxID=1543706 RepID=UPI00054415F2|nr:AimR family lysis-lysogeny pheromone receptor [Halobacillus sp. BBL2006]KHE71904.1 hypothetical protein LD39_07385 [Halobacillus sp. BBL2006]
MVKHQLIEPSPLHQLQMNHTSHLYEVYSKYLEDNSRELAAHLTKKYCLNHKPRSIEDQIAFLEFLYMNHFFSELELLIHSREFHNDVSLLYRLLLRRRHQAVSELQLKKIKSLKFSHPTLRCLHMFIIVQFYYDSKQYTGLDKYLEACDQALNEINEPLVYYYLNLRFNELLFHHYWKTNNSLLANRYAYKIINSELSSRNICHMYHQLALCNLFKGYQYSIHNAMIALELANKNLYNHTAKMIKHYTIPFISAFHRQTKNIYTPDPAESAHIAIAENNFKEAERILSRLTEFTPMEECYLGVATKSKEMLIRSNQRFIHELGDQFYAQIPLFYMDRFLTISKEG